MSSGGFHSLFSGSSKVGSFFATDTDVPHVDIAIANPYVFIVVLAYGIEMKFNAVCINRSKMVDIHPRH